MFCKKIKLDKCLLNKIMIYFFWKSQINWSSKILARSIPKVNFFHNDCRCPKKSSISWQGQLNKFFSQTKIYSNNMEKMSRLVLSKATQAWPKVLQYNFRFSWKAYICMYITHTIYYIQKSDYPNGLMKILTQNPA